MLAPAKDPNEAEIVFGVPSNSRLAGGLKNRARMNWTESLAIGVRRGEEERRRGEKHYKPRDAKIHEGCIVGVGT
jgi:hypothetical protein